MLSNLWNNHRAALLVGVSAAAIALAGVAAYLILKRPEDVSNPDAAFIEEEQTGKEVLGLVDWPIYGLNEERTRYLNAQDVEPPFKVAWQFKGRNLLEYSPILVDGSLYVVNNNGIAFAIKTRSGKARWRRDLAELNASSPAYSEGMLYVANLDPGQVLGLNAKNGLTRWKRELPGRTESSPIVVGDKVIVGCECGTLFAFDKQNGKTIWETDLAGAIKAGVAVSDGIAYVGDYGGALSAVRVNDGSIKWQTGSQGSSFGRAGRFYATAAIAFGRVYIGSIDSRMYSFEKETGDLAWSQSTGGYVYAAPAVGDIPGVGPTVYFGSYDGSFYALDARSGAERWSADPGGQVSGAASIVGETVYVANLDNTETLGFNVRNGERVFSFRDGAYNPVISDGKRLYLTGYERIYSMKPERRGGGKKSAAGQAKAKKKK